MQADKTGTISLSYALYYKKSDTREGERMITKPVIQSSHSEDVIKKASALLAHGRSIRMPQMNSLWVFSLSFGVILHTIKIKMGLHHANATVIQAQ